MNLEEMLEAYVESVPAWLVEYLSNVSHEQGVQFITAWRQGAGVPPIQIPALATFSPEHLAEWTYDIFEASTTEEQRSSVDIVLLGEQFWISFANQFENALQSDIVQKLTLEAATESADYKRGLVTGWNAGWTYGLSVGSTIPTSKKLVPKETPS